jgi:hypothetical protein
MAQQIIQYLLNNQLNLFLFISLPKAKKEKSYLSVTIFCTFQTKFAKLKKNPNVGSIQKLIYLFFLSPTPQPLELTRRSPFFRLTF